MGEQHTDSVAWVKPLCEISGVSLECTAYAATLKLTEEEVI